MKKIIEIKGMHCAHCQAKAEKALNAIPGVTAKVDLKKNRAVVSMTADVEDKTFGDALSEAGFEAASIMEKKGLFG